MEINYNRRWYTNGYNYIPVPVVKDGVLTERKELEHRLVVEDYLGRTLSENEVVHHLDFNRANNSPDNLLVLDNDQHTKLHSWLDKYTLTPTPEQESRIEKGCVRCKMCEKPILPDMITCSEACHKEMRRVYGTNYNNISDEILTKTSNFGEDKMYRNGREITRNEIQERIEKESMNSLAKEYGYSDNGFKKLCKRLGVDVRKGINVHKIDFHSPEGQEFYRRKENLLKNMSKENIEALLKENNNKEICKYLGFHEDSIETLCNKFNIDYNKIKTERKELVRSLLESVQVNKEGLIDKEDLEKLVTNGISKETIGKRYKISWRTIDKLVRELLLSKAVGFRVSYIADQLRKGITVEEIATSLEISIHSVMLSIYNYNQLFPEHQVLPSVDWLIEKLRINDNLRLLADKLGVSKEYLLSWLE